MGNGNESHFLASGVVAVPSAARVGVIYRDCCAVAAGGVETTIFAAATSRAYHLWHGEAARREAMMNINGNLEYDERALADFCRRWKVAELSLFGSVLGERFGPDSDVDVLVVFEPNDPWSYWDWGEMTEQLESIFGRPVDLVEKRSVVNPYRRHHILTSRRIIHSDAA